MRIAQVAPLIESVPPPYYGGTERVVSLLTDELVRRGHEVTLFATADSQTAARLVPGSSTSLRRALENEPAGRRLELQLAYHLAELGNLQQQLTEFDLVHSHLDSLAFPLLANSPRPVVSTTHGRLDLPEIQMVYRAFPMVPLVSISYSQKDYLRDACWMGTVYNAVLVEQYTLRSEPGTYLAFLGRFSREKGPDQAINLAIRTGIPLKLAAKIDPADRDYFETVVRPRLAHPLIEYIGEITDAEKNEFLGGALAHLSPIDWPEPFGITMVEAMACGTPVIARRRGSVPEVVVDGVTGFLGETLDDLERRIEAVGRLDRWACRRWVEQRFSPRVFAGGYEAVYRRLLEGTDAEPLAANAE